MRDAAENRQAISSDTRSSSAAPIPFSLDRAVPVVLVVNELLTNSLKHAFPDRETGTVRVEARRTADGTVTITVSDNGVVALGRSDGPGANSGLQTGQAAERSGRGDGLGRARSRHLPLHRPASGSNRVMIDSCGEDPH
jgi:anti-sigma regulatory factor (Ser/Thr protein kinase)